MTNPQGCSRGKGFVRNVCSVAAACLMVPCAWAHTSLEEYVRTNAVVSVSKENIDIRMQFTFPADLSLVERRQMDRNGDGTLSNEEQDAYLDAVLARSEKLLRLSVNGKKVMLIPLDDPALDLQDEAGVTAHPHELRLAFFARIPEGFGLNGEVVLDSGMWADAPQMVSVSMEGADGVRMRAKDRRGLRPPSRDGKAGLFRMTEARCTEWGPRNRKDGSE